MDRDATALAFLLLLRVLESALAVCERSELEDDTWSRARQKWEKSFPRELRRMLRASLGAPQELQSGEGVGQAEHLSATGDPQQQLAQRQLRGQRDLQSGNVPVPETSDPGSLMQTMRSFFVETTLQEVAEYSARRLLRSTIERIRGHLRDLGDRAKIDVGDPLARKTRKQLLKAQTALKMRPRPHDERLRVFLLRMQEQQTRGPSSTRSTSKQVENREERRGTVTSRTSLLLFLLRLNHSLQEHFTEDPRIFGRADNIVRLNHAGPLLIDVMSRLIECSGRRVTVDVGLRLTRGAEEESCSQKDIIVDRIRVALSRQRKNSRGSRWEWLGREPPRLPPLRVPRQSSTEDYIVGTSNNGSVDVHLGCLVLQRQHRLRIDEDAPDFLPELTFFVDGIRELHVHSFPVGGHEDAQRSDAVKVPHNRNSRDASSSSIDQNTRRMVFQTSLPGSALHWVPFCGFQGMPSVVSRSALVRSAPSFVYQNPEVAGSREIHQEYLSLFSGKVILPVS
ncbi:unnamed protein product [Amoebophrya sp. A25]|nr:unnamed protein product [Amoebophrya sp. A25]|eukprot:GSA25T00005784001.1